MATPIRPFTKKLENQVAADALRRVVQGLGGGVQLADADQAQQAVPQILTLDENENGEDQHEAEHPDGREKRFGELLEMGDRAGLGGYDLHRKRVVRSGAAAAWGRALFSRELLRNGGHIFFDAAQGSGGGGAEPLHFVVDVFAIGGKVVHDVDQLIADHPADDAGEARDGKHDDDDGGDSSKMDALQPGGERSQDQAEGQGEGEGDEDFPREVEDGERRDEDADQREGRPLVGRSIGGSAVWKHWNSVAVKGPKHKPAESRLPAGMPAPQDAESALGLPFTKK